MTLNANSRPRLPFRAGSFTLSLFVHSVLVALAFQGPFHQPQTREPERAYTVVMTPLEKKLIWYVPKQLPAVSPVQRIGEGDTVRGRIQSPDQSMITAPPKATPGRQFIWQPAPNLPPVQETKLPNLVAIEAPLAPPPPPRPAPKRFAPPPSAPRQVQPPALVASPQVQLGAVELSRASLSSAVQAPALPKPRAEAFVPPKEQTVHAPAAPVFDQAPNLRTAAVPVTGLPTSVLGGPAIATAPKPQAKKFVPPSLSSNTGEGTGNGANGNGSGAGLEAPPDLNTTAVPGNLTGVVLGLDPSDRLTGSIPQGSNAVALSRAPVLGPPSSGGGDPSAVAAIPNIAVGPAARETPPARTTERQKITGQHAVVLGPSDRTLSVPLRPSSRTVPRAIDMKFRGRAIYTMVVPMPKLPDYGGDWIVWFAEREHVPGSSPEMRAPGPVRKIETVGDSAPAEGKVERRVRLTATVLKDGTLDSISVMEGIDPRVNQRAVEDLQKWEFRPALRSGKPVETEVIIEIPFLIAGQLAQQQ